MTAITFNTLKLSKGLREAGFSADQAEKVAEVIAETVTHAVNEVHDELVTKNELARQLAELEMRTQKHTYTVVMTALSINIMALIGAVFAIVKILGH